MIGERAGVLHVFVVLMLFVTLLVAVHGEQIVVLVVLVVAVVVV